MKNQAHDIRLLEQLLDRYKFIRPVPDDFREEILSSKKENMVKVLKTVGAFSALYGLLLSFSFTIKKLGVSIPLIKIVASCLTAAAVTCGGYYAVKVLKSPDVPRAPVEKKEERRQPEEQRQWVDQITLYNGRVIQGAIISRGNQYRVRTAGGIIQIPRNKIKMIKPLKIESNPKNGGPMPDVPVTQ